jgi:hypothetical protein
MRCCGGDIQGSELVLVMVQETDDGGFEVDRSQCAKIRLSDPASQPAVRAFFAALSAFVKSNKIKKIALKGRLGKGQFSAGATSFKIETMMQLLEDCEIDIIYPATIAAQKRKVATLPVPSIHQYQQDAFWVSYTALNRKG